MRKAKQIFVDVDQDDEPTWEELKEIEKEAHDDSPMERSTLSSNHPKLGRHLPSSSREGRAVLVYHSRLCRYPFGRAWQY